MHYCQPASQPASQLTILVKLGFLVCLSVNSMAQTIKYTRHTHAAPALNASLIHIVLSSVGKLMSGSPRLAVW